MRGIYLLLSILIMVLGISVSVQAALVDMHDGTIYDTDTQLSWLQNANTAGPMTWANANAWAASLNSGSGFAGLTGWRLPADFDYYGCFDYNCTNSEMGHLYYTELGNAERQQLTNVGPFTNVRGSYYWSVGVYCPEPTYAWVFDFFDGRQTVTVKDFEYYAWAVRHGARSNGIVESGEQCDDGNSTDGDGCSATCTIESGWICSGSPSICTLSSSNYLSPGTNVNVAPTSDTTFTFNSVTIGGTLTVTGLSNPSPPANFRIPSGKSYDITFTGTFSGPVTVCLRYNDSDVHGNENNLKLMHFKDAIGWTDITTSLDTVNNIICGETISFSEFAVVEPLATPSTGALVDMQDGTIYDKDKQLSWLKDPKMSGLMTWDQAVAWAASLNIAGLTGWRLPTTTQPDATCQDQGGGASYGLNCTNSEMGHLFYTELGNASGGSLSHNTGPFTSATGGIYWTSTDWPPDPAAAFAFYWYDGGQYGYLKFGNYYAWAVRPGARPVPSNLVDMNDGTIYDTDTQLSWLKDAKKSGFMTWDQAVAWAASLNVAGLTGWRLPNADPLCTVPLSCTNSEMGHLYYAELGNEAGGPLTNLGPFTNLQDTNFYWSGNEYMPSPTSAWTFDFLNGGQYTTIKNLLGYALVVRPGARYTGNAQPIVPPGAGVGQCGPDDFVSPTLGSTTTGFEVQDISTFMGGLTGSVYIDWGDGSPMEIIAAGATSGLHTYANPGTYKIRKTTKDNIFGFNCWKEAEVTVSDLASGGFGSFDITANACAGGALANVNVYLTSGHLSFHGATDISGLLTLPLVTNTMPIGSYSLSVYAPQGMTCHPTSACDTALPVTVDVPGTLAVYCQ